MHFSKLYKVKGAQEITRRNCVKCLHARYEYVDCFDKHTKERATGEGKEG